jgi:outer membrane lipoprotein carrier protein
MTGDVEFNHLLIHMNFFLAAIFSLVFSLFSTASELSLLIQNLQNKYARMTTLSADFIQVYSAPNARSRRESGRLQLKKPGKMRWDYVTPEAKQYVADGKFVYEYLPVDRVATRTSANNLNDWRTPFLFLLGRGNLRRDFSRIEFSSEAPVKAGHQVLRLIPKRNSEILEVIIEVEPGSLQLSRLSFLKSGQSRIDFLLSNVQENGSLPDSNFEFKVPGGVTLKQY